MTDRFITRNGKKMHLVSTTETKPGARNSRIAIKKFNGSKHSLIVKLSKKQSKYEGAKYGIYVR